MPDTKMYYIREKTSNGKGSAWRVLAGFAKEAVESGDYCYTTKGYFKRQTNEEVKMASRRRRFGAQRRKSPMPDFVKRMIAGQAKRVTGWNDYHKRRKADAGHTTGYLHPILWVGKDKRKREAIL